MANDRVKIKITKMPDFGGSSFNLYCEMVLGLKVAREKGDTEVVSKRTLKWLKREDVGFEIVK